MSKICLKCGASAGTFCGLCGNVRCSNPNPGNREASRCHLLCDHEYLRQNPFDVPDTKPFLIGRTEDYFYKRAGTDLLVRISEDFHGVCWGTFSAELRRSSIEDDGKYDGLVLVLKTDRGEGDGNFQPHAVNVENGVEIHIAGGGEVEAAVRTLLAVLARWELRSTRRHPGA